MPSVPSAIALLSGGLDSALALYMAHAEGWQIRRALTFDYGQRSAIREIAQAQALSQHFGILHRSLALPWFREWAADSTLLDRTRPLPRPDPLALDSLGLARESAKAVWVPNRNGIFIEIAAGFAEHEGAQAVIVGFNREEAQTFPDNSLEYLRTITDSLRYSTMHKVAVISPTSTLDKTEIVRVGKEVGFPFHMLWSCYEDFARMCGLCESCQRLKRALRTNGVEYDALFENSNSQR